MGINTDMAAVGVTGIECLKIIQVDNLKTLMY
jgi:hypothetical protein